MNENLKQNILIVDDEKSNIDIILELFKVININNKYNIIATLSAKKALKVIEKRKIDLILLDIMMPNMDGYEMCRILKSNNETKDIPIIFITARIDENSIKKAFDVGGVDYLTKPFYPQELLARVTTQLSIIEQVQIKNKLIQEQAKLASMGMMIGNIAHQWRQPLSVISTITTGLRLKYELATLDLDSIPKKIDNIESQVIYLSKTIDIFTNFLKEKKEFQEVILQDRIDVALVISKVLLNDYGIELKNNVDYENPIYISLVVGELVEVIINIINNAKDILVEKEIDFPWVKLDVVEEKGKVIITIEDNGGGIAEDVLPNIFDEYFTTKDNNLGTGLGLYMSYEIICRSLKGKLYAKNSEHGAKFYIELPLDLK